MSPSFLSSLSLVLKSLNNFVNNAIAMLMVLEYLREYRTYFHISKIYGVSEGYIYQLILWVEDTLIRSKLFSLPERQALLKSNFDYEVILS